MYLFFRSMEEVVLCQMYHLVELFINVSDTVTPFQEIVPSLFSSAINLSSLVTTRLYRRASLYITDCLQLLK